MAAAPTQRRKQWLSKGMDETVVRSTDSPESHADARTLWAGV
ncbi:MAG: hypothetical protein ACPG6X_01075 [Synechococcus sp.]